MKKFLLICLFAAVISSCSDETSIVESNDTFASSLERTPEEAIALANMFGETIATESRTKSNLTAKECVALATAVSRAENDTLMYAVNYDGNNGFVLISAKRNVEPIIGYVEEGNYIDSQKGGNDNFSYYIECAQSYIIENSSSTLGDIGFYDPYTITVLDNITPKLMVNWGQSIPEGLYCDNGIAGCVQTAMAQICSFFEYPAFINLTYPNHGDSDKLNISWTVLKRHTTADSNQSYSQHLANCGVSDYIHCKLAHLCREFGHRNNADYSNPKATGASSYKARENLSQILKSHHVGKFNSFNSDYTNMYDSISSCNAIAYLGGAGHAWVCDGAKVIKTVYKGVPNAKPGSEWYSENTNYYYHFNWGWYGDSNGYFLAGVFDSTKGVENPSRANFPGSQFFVVSFK